MEKRWILPVDSGSIPLLCTIVIFWVSRLRRESIRRCPFLLSPFLKTSHWYKVKCLKIMTTKKAKIKRAKELRRCGLDWATAHKVAKKWIGNCFLDEITVQALGFVRIYTEPHYYGTIDNWEYKSLYVHPKSKGMGIIFYGFEAEIVDFDLPKEDAQSIISEALEVLSSIESYSLHGCISASSLKGEKRWEFCLNVGRNSAEEDHLYERASAFLEEHSLPIDLSSIEDKDLRGAIKAMLLEGFDPKWDHVISDFYYNDEEA